jgi:arylsulfatase A-like enzyme
VDLFPTLLDLAGIESAGHDGVNLLEEPASGMDRPQVAAYLEPKTRAVSLVSSANPDFDGRPWMSPLRSIEVDEWKLIAAKDGRRWLYDLANDPSESSDLSGQRGDKTAALAQRLESWVAQHRSEEPEGERRRAEPDAEHLERLRGLGYIVGEPGEDTDTGGDDR